MKKIKLTRQGMLELKSGDKIRIESRIKGEIYCPDSEVTVIEVYKSKKFERVKYRWTDQENRDRNGIGNFTIGKNIDEDGTIKCSISSSNSVTRFNRSIFKLNK